jgi:hypothetical protein
MGYFIHGALSSRSEQVVEVVTVALVALFSPLPLLSSLSLLLYCCYHLLHICYCWDLICYFLGLSLLLLLLLLLFYRPTSLFLALYSLHACLLARSSTFSLATTTSRTTLLCWGRTHASLLTRMLAPLPTNLSACPVVCLPEIQEYSVLLYIPVHFAPLASPLLSALPQHARDVMTCTATSESAL